MTHWTTADWIGAISATANVIAALATLIGFALAYRQLRLSLRQARTTFEDTIGQEYRELARDLPYLSLLGEKLDLENLSEDQKEKIMSAFVHYFDLCNYQIYLRHHRRISAEIWREWASGMRANFDKPAFREAWSICQEKSGHSFRELKEAIANQFARDPGQ